MSELQNPLFDEEKEFLERKKLEYERALRGDVEHIKDQSVVVGKVALVGAGLVGGIWLITKMFSGKKRKHRAPKSKEFDHDEPDHDYEFGAEYFTADNGKRYRSVRHEKSAAESANAFTEHFEQTSEADDLGFGSTAAPHHAAPSAPAARQHEAAGFDSDDFEDDPFQDLPYDDSRRLHASHDFDVAAPAAQRASSRANMAAQVAGSRANMVGLMLQSFLQSDTGKVLVAQVAAVALAMVTKKVSEYFPAPKNSDLATSPGYAPAETGFSPVASFVSPVAPDASSQP